jgi:tol-pal system protein YbgF
MRRFPVSLIGALLLVTAGCVFPEQVRTLEGSVAEIRQKLAAVEKTQADSLQKLDAIEAKLGDGGTVTRQEFADLKVELEGVTRGVATAQEGIQDANRRMDRLSQDVAASRDATRRMTAPVVPVPVDPSAPTVPAPTPGGGAVPSPESLYNAAYADFSKGNYPLAISGFEEYATRFPDSDLADNAIYWIGECYFGQGKFGAAVQAFDLMLVKYPKGDRVAAANLKKGLALLEDNKVAQAIVQLKYVVATYPGSDEARVAKDKLASLGKPAS